MAFQTLLVLLYLNSSGDQEEDVVTHGGFGILNEKRSPGVLKFSKLYPHKMRIYNITAGHQ